MPRKGSSFERQVAKQLSAWWTGDPESDFVFWRATTSGSFATSRAKKGKTTKGHCGDICAVDPIGEPFTNLITLEIKRGYSTVTCQDLIDKPWDGKSRANFLRFILQARDASDRAGTPYWWLIQRRDKAHAVVWMPVRAFYPLLLRHWLSPCTYVRTEETGTIVGCLLSDVLEFVEPDRVRELANDP